VRKSGATFFPNNETPRGFPPSCLLAAVVPPCCPNRHRAVLRQDRLQPWGAKTERLLNQSRFLLTDVKEQSIFLSLGYALVIRSFRIAPAVFLLAFGFSLDWICCSLPHDQALNFPGGEFMKDNGLVRIPSRYSVEETLQRLESALAARGLQVFARIDHSGEAEKIGLKMPATKLLIFGSPKAGTPLMLTAPTLAIDLPLKALVAEDDQGKVWLSYISPEFLKERHGIPDDLIKNIAGAGALLEGAVE